jgi:hypothetical protein
VGKQIQIVGREISLKAPSTKLQHPEKLQSFKHQDFAHGNFEV